MICVLLLAAGHPWEAAALASLDADRGVTVLKRCVDVDDLLAAATTGQADVAVLALDAPGVDPAAVAHLRRSGVRPVVVAHGGADDLDVREQAQRLQVRLVLGPHEMAGLAEALAGAEDAADTRGRDGASDVVEPFVPADAADATGEGEGRTVVVWGPAGAPGRTTVAVNLASELARRHAATVLADLDPWGGSVAQQLGILDEVSGVLAGARLAGAGQLEDRLGSALRGVDDHLAVLTGLPRADRWREVRGSHVEQLLLTAATRGHVVVDAGFSLEEEPGGDLTGRPSRNTMTTTALDLADEVVVVGSADPVGLSRLARGLVDLHDRVVGVPVRVVVNRMRPSIGWSEKDIAGMVEGFSRTAGLHFLPDDRAATDRALVTGRAVVHGPEGPLTHGLASLVDAIFPDSVTADGAAGGRRRAIRRPRAAGNRRFGQGRVK